MANQATVSRKPFTPAARLMVLLGDQLIRDASLAVFELVKNAYDADARHCTVTLKNVNTKNGEIEVKDDGSGMTLGTVISAWLRPGTRTRLDRREAMLKDVSRSKKFGRLPLGEKGVGRFAAHKLGDDIKLITRADGEDEVVVDVNWRDFDTDKPLDQVRVRVTEREPEVFTGKTTGTRITVSGFREGPWTRGQVRSLHRAVTSICSPLHGPSDFAAKIVLTPDPDGWLDDLLSSEQVREYALFHFRGDIDSDGLKYTYRFRPPRHWKGVAKRDAVRSRQAIPWPEQQVVEESMPLFQGLGSSVNTKDQWRGAGLGRVGIEFDIFDLDRKTLSALEADPKGLKEYLKQNGGVRVYRDGVRVYDFGEPGNDWLDLGGKRVNIPTKRIGNNQILGEVHLSLRDSRSLVEKTNREGFVENKAFQLFRQAVEYAIGQAQAERNVDKARIRASEKAEKDRDREPVIDDLAALKDEIMQIALPATHTDRLVRYVDQIDKQYREVTERLLTAASSGLNLTLVLHEVEKGIRHLYNALKSEASHERVLVLAKELAEQVDSIAWLLRQGGNANVKVSDLIEHMDFAWHTRFAAHDIEFINAIGAGSPNFTTKCNRRLVMSALMNLVDNSIYWLGTVAKGRKLWVGTSLDLSEGPAIVVADNGPGFSDPPEHLVVPFFTRKPEGTGLGLHLASEIMKNHGGQLVFPARGDVKIPKDMKGAVVALAFRGGH